MLISSAVALLLEKSLLSRVSDDMAIKMSSFRSVCLRVMTTNIGSIAGLLFVSLVASASMAAFPAVALLMVGVLMGGVIGYIVGLYITHRAFTGLSTTPVPVNKQQKSKCCGLFPALSPQRSDSEYHRLDDKDNFSQGGMERKRRG